ncbi:unnamed protein product, partial [Clonostachys chloroleuca]
WSIAFPSSYTEWKSISQTFLGEDLFHCVSSFAQCCFWHCGHHTLRVGVQAEWDSRTFMVDEVFSRGSFHVRDVSYQDLLFKLIFTYGWHMAFLAGVFLDLYSPKYWNFDTIIQQETRISNILLADKLCYRQMIIGEVWFCVLCFSYLQTRHLRAAMLRLVPAAIGIFLRGWAKKSEIPDLSPSVIIWGSACIMLRLFLAIQLWKQSPKVNGDVLASAISYILYVGYRT